MILETHEVLARLDLELSQSRNAKAVERLMASASGECDACSENEHLCEWCHYWEFNLDDPEEYAKEDATGRILINDWDIWLDSRDEQEERYNYNKIEGYVKDFMGNEFYRGDIIAYATRRGNGSVMVVAEYLEPAENELAIFVKPLRETTWRGNGIDRPPRRTRITTDNVLLLESK